MKPKDIAELVTEEIEERAKTAPSNIDSEKPRSNLSVTIGYYDLAIQKYLQEIREYMDIFKSNSSVH